MTATADLAPTTYAVPIEPAGPRLRDALAALGAVAFIFMLVGPMLAKNIVDLAAGILGLDRYGGLLREIGDGLSFALSAIILVKARGEILAGVTLALLPLGFRPGRVFFGCLAATFVLNLGALALMQVFGVAPHPIGTPNPGALVALLIVVVLIGPLTEEITFRGAVQGVLGHVMGRVAAILLATVLFALVHYDRLGMGAAFATIYFAKLMLDSVIYGICRERYDSVTPAFVLHAISNATVIGTPLLIAAIG